MRRRLGPEAARGYAKRLREGFFEKYLAGDAVLDIGYRGSRPDSVPITDKAIGVELDFPGYDGTRLPFDDATQDAVFVSHVLEHIVDYSAVIADWYRVLKIGGYLIICVPHQYLYERKATLPSRFNGDHRRFYTPASLLREVEQCLPLAGYRIRGLRDIDDGFNYTVPPEIHAQGCYEIELVIEKIAIPFYAERMYLSRVSAEVIKFFNTLLAEAIAAHRAGRADEVEQIQGVLQNMPLPPFMHLDCPTADHPTEDERMHLLHPIVRYAPFDEERYLRQYPELSRAIADGRFASARDHYILHGYFEGRSAGPNDHLFE